MRGQHTYAVMVPDHGSNVWQVYEVDDDRTYCQSIAQELWDSGHEAGVMELR